MRRSIELYPEPGTAAEFRNKDVLYTAVTRFNVRWGGEAAAARRKNWKLNVEWLKQRVGVFEKYCLPTMTKQTVHPHAWFVMFDKRLSRETSMLIDRLFSYDWIVPMLVNDQWRDYVAQDIREICDRKFANKEFTHACTVRIDSDDSLNLNYLAWTDRAISQLRSEWDTPEPRTINFPFGAVCLHNDFFVEHKPRQFYSIFEPLADLDTPYRRNHRLIGEVSDVYDVFTRQPMYIYWSHDANITDMSRYSVSNRPAFRDQGALLDQFGLPHTLLQDE